MVLPNNKNEAVEKELTEKRTKMLQIYLGILLYYPLSIGLTFYQKWFIKSYKHPLFVVAGHYLFKYLLAIAVRFLLECCRGRRIRIAFREQLRWLVPIGVCASLDISLSNWALEYVTVSLYTMAKSSSILFIVAFALLLRLERWRTVLGFSAALIAVGLFLFTWRSTAVEIHGLLLVELAAASTGIRWTFSQLIMQRDDQAIRHPLDMVAHVQPWMFLTILPLLFIFEGSEISYQSVLYYKGVFDPFVVFVLILFGGCLAFAMEMSEYLLLVHTSGITLSIFGIIKEVVTLLLAYLVNGDRLTTVNLFGLFLCLSGMLLHALSKKRKLNERFAPPPDPQDRRSLLSEPY